MPDPPISTVIAAFNAARFLPEAINSALAQDYGTHEVIVVDDGSTDETPQLASRYPSLKWIRHEANRGVAAARNTALDAVEGEYVAILDSDDQMVPGRLRRQVDRLLGDPTLGCVLGQQEILVEPGAKLPDWARDMPKLNWREDGPDAPFYCASSGLYSRSALDQIGPYDEELRIGEDVDLIFRLSEAGYAIGTIEEPAIVRRVHGNNLTGADDSVLRALPAVLSRRIARKRAAAGR